MEKLLIIDGNSLVNRAFYALPLLTNKDGEYSNAVYGFVNILVKCITEIKPEYICVAFDHSRHTFRTEMYAAYKGTRKEMAPELRSQMPLLKTLLNLMNISIFEVPGIEADDIIGTIAKHSGITNIIVSGDRDLLQLIDDKTEVWLTKKGITDVEKINVDNIKDAFQLSPSQIVDLKALMGDASDNIPGVSGVGSVTATSLLKKYSTLDNIYANIENISGKLKDKLVSGKDDAYLSYKLATINTNCDINVNVKNFEYDFPFNVDVKLFFEKYQFRSLLRRQELFSDNANELQSSVRKLKENRIEIKDENQLKDILNGDVKYLAFDFLNDLEFSINDDAVYFISSQKSLFSSIDEDMLLKNLTPLLYDEKVLKITYDLKSHLHKNDVFLNMKGEIFDVSIALYLVHAGEKIGKDIITQEFGLLRIDLLKQMEQLGLMFVYNNIEIPLTYVLYKMEKNGFYINGDMLSSLNIKYKNELNEIQDKIYSYTSDDFNLNSPKQVATVLFDELKLSDFNNKKHSTSIEFLNMLAEEHPIVPLIIRYRKIQKLVSGYLDPYTKLVNEKGECIHTVFNQTLTATGRLSSSEPNLQNLPIKEEDGRNLRKLFVSRFENGCIVSADYNQIELRLLASFSNDKNLIDAYLNGADIHRATASKIFSKPFEEVTPFERSSAKAVNFGIVYGISPFGLSNQLNISAKEAKVFMDKYHETYPGVLTYMQKNVISAKETGMSRTMFGRIRKINELYSANRNMQQFGERVAMNMPLQGSASDIIKLAMIKVEKELRKNNLKSQMILQIHDELIVDCAFNEEDKVKEILKNCMENIVKLQVPLIVSIGSGKTWYDAK